VPMPARSRIGADSFPGRLQGSDRQLPHGPEATHPPQWKTLRRCIGTVEELQTKEYWHLRLFGRRALTAENGCLAAAHGLPKRERWAYSVRSGALRRGDSAWIAAYIDAPSRRRQGPAKRSPTSPGLFRNADMADPIISPALHPDVVAKFPPALIITGTRAMT